MSLRSVCYGPLGDVIAVGLGGDKTQNHPKVGAYVILNEEDLSVIHEAKDSNTPITVVSYSPEGETLAIGVEDGMIFLYAVHDDYELVGRCVRHTHPILHIDFSVDGEWIRTNDTGGELYFFNTDNASLQSNAAAMRDVKWLTNSAVASWPTTAVHDHLFQSEMVTSASVPPNILLASNSVTTTKPIAESSTYDYIACGTSYGYLCLFSYPCVPHDAEYHRSPAHAGAIGEVRFSSDSQFLITCGRDDRCLVQWRCRAHQPPDERDPEVVKSIEGLPEYQESEDYGLEMRGRSDIEEDVMVSGCNIVSGLLNNQSKPPDLPRLAEDEAHAAILLTESKRQAQLAEAMNVWLEGTVEPNNPSNQNTAPPDVTMRLEYVHGYKGQEMRNNIRYNDREEIVYCCASIGIVMDRTSKSQKFYQAHSQSISAFACSRNGKYAATGDIGETPRVLIWDTRTCTTLRILPDIQMKAIVSLAFSNSGDLVAVVSLDNDHTISVYEWRSNLLLCRGFNGSKRIVQVSFSDDDRQLLSCGLKEIKVWNLSTWSLSSITQTICDGGRHQPFLCCTYFSNLPTVGTVDGHFYVFQQNTLHHAIKAHSGGVHAIHVSLTGDQLVSGGKDGLIKIWNSSLDCVKELSVETILPAAQPSISPRVRSVCFSKDSQFLLVGTRGAEIFEVRISNSSIVGPKPLMQSHGCRELYGLATHPTKDEFITSGDDATIRLWDTNACTQIRCIRMDSPSRTIAYSPDGRFVAVGFGCSGRKNRMKSSAKDGAFVVLGANDLKMVHEGKDSNEAIRFVKFSNDSKILAVGSEDSKIFLYNVRDHYSRRCTINCHRAPVVSADFSNDNSFLMSIDITKRICYSETTSGAHIPSPTALRDQKWATWSSPVGWPVKGLWAIQPAGSEPCSVQRSWGGMLLACGNTDGRVFVVHNPCQGITGFVGDNGHAGPVAQVGWIAGDTSIITIGAKDHSICQWKLIYDNNRESGDEGGLSCEDSELERDGGNDVLIQNVFQDDERATHSLSGAQQQAWMSNVTPPTHIKDDVETLPPVKLEIDHVHGIRSGDCRNGLKYNDDGNLIFFASRVGVIYDRKSHQQRVYDAHEYPIIALDVGVGGKIVATGELAYNPEIHFWDARTSTQLSVVRDIHRNGVISVSFSPSGTSLATLGQDTLHSVVILKSCTGRWIEDVFVSSSVNVSISKMFWIFHSDESSGEFPIIAGGDRCIYYFKTVGKTLEKVKGTFGRKRKIQSILCAVEISLSNRFLVAASANRLSVKESASGAPDHLEKVLLTGTVTGHVYFWLNQRIKTTLTAHDAPIYALSVLDHYAGGRFATGGKDGLVKIWSEALQLLYAYNLQTFSPSPYSLSCHSLVATNSSSKIAIGITLPNFPPHTS
jgi:WD40 repeat protein